MRNRTLFGSLMLIGVMVAALAGGSYAVFTDTESSHVRFKAGSIDIQLSGEVYTKTYLFPDGFNDWKPGDHDEFELNITNKDNRAWIQIYIYETPPWTEGRPNFWDVATWGVDYQDEWNQWELGKDENMTVDLWVDFPQWVGNNYEKAQGDLLILVVAKQWRNKLQDGYSCVALEDKPGPAYLPILDNNLEGVICFKPTGNDGELAVDLNAYGLTPGAFYQLDFTGGDMKNPIDGACTAQDDALAGMPGDLFVSGYWNWGTTLEAACNDGNGGEGVWNYAGVYPATAVVADASGAISFGGVLTGLPDMLYEGIGAHVKEIRYDSHELVMDPRNLPGNEWNVVLSEMDYLSFEIP